MHRNSARLLIVLQCMAGSQTRKRQVLSSQGNKRHPPSRRIATTTTIFRAVEHSRTGYLYCCRANANDEACWEGAKSGKCIFCFRTRFQESLDNSGMRLITVMQSSGRYMYRLAQSPIWSSLTSTVNHQIGNNKTYRSKKFLLYWSMVSAYPSQAYLHLDKWIMSKSRFKIWYKVIERSVK